MSAIAIERLNGLIRDIDEAISEVNGHRMNHLRWAKEQQEKIDHLNVEKSALEVAVLRLKGDVA